MRSGHHISSQLPATDPPRRGPSFHALSASRLPVPPQKHASREQRLREKVSYTFFERGGGEGRTRVLSPSSSLLPPVVLRPISVAIHVHHHHHHYRHLYFTPRSRGSKRRVAPDEPVSTRGKRKRGEEKRRRKRKTNRISRPTTPRDNGE